MRYRRHLITPRVGKPTQRGSPLIKKNLVVRVLSQLYLTSKTYVKHVAGDGGGDEGGDEGKARVYIDGQRALDHPPRDLGSSLRVNLRAIRGRKAARALTYCRRQINRSVGGSCLQFLLHCLSNATGGSELQFNHEPCVSLFTARLCTKVLKLRLFSVSNNSVTSSFSSQVYTE